jgi:hypothetical protein
MDNLVAIVVVLGVVAVLMVAAEVWFYVLLGLYAVYGLCGCRPRSTSADIYPLLPPVIATACTARR